MARKYYLINLLLILIIVFLVKKNYREWRSPLAVREESASSKQRTMVVVSSSPAGKKEIPDPAVFRSVSEKNVFSPDRKEFPVLLVNPAIKKPPVRPNVQLFGVTLGPDFHSAIINNPTRRADKGERETITVIEGDRVGEYKVTSITEDRITLESSGDSFDVVLYDPAKQTRLSAIAPTRTPTPPTPTVPPVYTPPPRPYTPPAMTRPQIPPTRSLVPPASTSLPPGQDEEDDSEDDED